MPVESWNEHDILQQLARVLSSSGFARNERMSRFLRFLVERHLQGNDNEIKESVVAVEVFNRKPDYDPKHDSIVRTEAGRLRARLAEYYAVEGRAEPIIIELPRGAYIPRFRRGQREPDVRQTRVGRRRRMWTWAAAVVVAAAAWGEWSVQGEHRPIPIAVLPLESLSENSADADFARGLTDDIIRNLSVIEGLAVRSRTSVLTFKNTPRNVRETGTQLEADYLLEGSVRRAGQQLRINAQLIRVRDDVPVWSDRFDRDVTDVFASQDEISRDIVNGLRLKLGGGRRRYETSADAYELYLRARTSANREFPGGAGPIGVFEQSIGKDSSMAPAYAGLAAAYAWRSFQGPLDPDRADQLANMRRAAEKAIQVDPLLPDAHTALGTAYARDGEWALAERSFRRAIEIDPNLSMARQSFARFVLWPLGRIEEAVRQARTAVARDPQSPWVRYELAVLLLTAGRYEEAASECEELPTEMVVKSECLGRAWVAQGRAADAIPLLSVSPTHNWGYLAYAYARAGRGAEAERLMDSAPKLYPDRRGPFQYALVFAGFGDKDATISQLERMADVGPVRIGFTLNSPEFAFVRSEPRVNALRQQVGLPGNHTDDNRAR